MFNLEFYIVLCIAAGGPSWDVARGRGRGSLLLSSRKEDAAHLSTGGGQGQEDQRDSVS